MYVIIEPNSMIDANLELGIIPPESEGGWENRRNVKLIYLTWGEVKRTRSVLMKYKVLTLLVLFHFFSGSSGGSPFFWHNWKFIRSITEHIRHTVQFLYRVGLFIVIMTSCTVVCLKIAPPDSGMDPVEQASVGRVEELCFYSFSWLIYLPRFRLGQPRQPPGKELAVRLYICTALYIVQQAIIYTVQMLRLASTNQLLKLKVCVVVRLWLSGWDQLMR